MPTITWNKPYLWISQDDHVATPWQIIEGKNIDWLRTWYAWTLWPKTTKRLLTTAPIRAIDTSSTTWEDDETYWAWDWWNIYKFDTLDNTPNYTLPWGEDIHAFMHFKEWVKFYFMKQTSPNFFSLCYVPSNEAQADIWTWVVENIKTLMRNPQSPIMYTTGSFIYIWYTWNILRIDSAWVQTVFSIFNSDIVWIAEHGTQFYIYSSQWLVSVWDWVSASISAKFNLWTRITRIITRWGIDYVLTEKGELYPVTGYSIWENPLSIPKNSNRLNDNTQYVSKLDFKNRPYDNKQMVFVWKDLMLLSNETQPWIYKYWNLLPWMAKRFHKISTEDNTSTDIDEIFTMTYSDYLNTLFFTYKQWAIYWIDMLELNNLTTSQDWYFISDIIRWVPNQEAKTLDIRMVTSYTSWDNYIKLWQRVNNWVWEEVRNINNDTDEIDLEEIEIENDEWLDIQFKIEIHNDLQSEFPPLLHEFNFSFDKVN